MANLTTRDVLLFYPNLIGYLRFLFMVISFATALSNWKVSVLAYLLAFGGDVVDGYVARAFQQCSRFGGVLDMVTDRVSTCGLLVILSRLYPDYLLAFTFLIVLDITSHWFHVMSVTSHHKSKEALEHRNALLQWYYSIYPLFGYCCVGTEVFYVLLYVLHFLASSSEAASWYPLLRSLCFVGCLPACVLKQLVNVVQLTSAMEALAAQDAQEANEKKK
eukprot:gene11034-12284_t